MFIFEFGDTLWNGLKLVGLNNFEKSEASNRGIMLTSSDQVIHNNFLYFCMAKLLLSKTEHLIGAEGYLVQDLSQQSVQKIWPMIIPLDFILHLTRVVTMPQPLSPNIVSSLKSSAIKSWGIRDKYNRMLRK